MKVFAFRYSSCIHEEGMISISLHKTEKGAKKAMRKHKTKEKKEWKEFIGRNSDIEGYAEFHAFGEHEHWDVREIKIQD